jgi:hypothetical protein
VEKFEDTLGDFLLEHLGFHGVETSFEAYFSRCKIFVEVESATSTATEALGVQTSE